MFLQLEWNPSPSHFRYTIYAAHLGRGDDRGREPGSKKVGDAT